MLAKPSAQFKTNHMTSNSLAVKVVVVTVFDCVTVLYCLY